MIRHVAELSGTVATIPLGMQGATTGRRLIASASFPLPVAAGFLRAGSDAVDLAAVTSSTNENLTATASAQEYPARSFLHTCWIAGSTCSKPALCFSQLRQSSVLRSRALPSLSDFDRSSDAPSTSGVRGKRQPVGMWTTQERCPQTLQAQQQATAAFEASGNQHHQVRVISCPTRLSARPTATPLALGAIFTRILTAVHTKRTRRPRSRLNAFLSYFGTSYA